MSKTARPAPPDQSARERALDPTRSILVQAPAGSGKTDLLTRRFLRLLAAVDDPAHIVAITFTKAAAAEMRNRILTELERAAAHPSTSDDEFSMEALAERALGRSRVLGWNLLELPSQLRISTIDSFCREIASQRPLLSTLGSGLEIAEQPDELYRRAARNTLLQLGSNSAVELQQAIETLLLWRDNNWQELEDHLVLMLRQRDRWMQEFWLRDFDPASESDWNALREQLERPFARAVAAQLNAVCGLLQSVTGACEEAMELARFASTNIESPLYADLAELAEFPTGPFATVQELEDARLAHVCLAQLLLTNDGAFRQRITKANGFPTDRIREKGRLQDLIRVLSAVEGLEEALAALSVLPPARYSDEDWRIVRATFTLLRHASAELQVAFAEAGVVDFIEIAQIAQRILEGDDNLPSDAALAIGDSIHHLLVDEFQDTSRRQHKLIASIVGAWPDAIDRTLFVVGDPMQSIYFFRDADAELFPRVQALGLELPDGEPLLLDFVQLESNFRTRPALVERLNETFDAVFRVNDGSNVQFSASQPARSRANAAGPEFSLHLNFVPQSPRGSSGNASAGTTKQQTSEQRQAAIAAQVDEIVALIRSHADRMNHARAHGEKYRIAVLGRTRTALEPIAQALHQASIPFRAVDLEPLADRPEILDVLALARALMNTADRVAWLGVLRAPWCGLSLADVHALTSADDPALLTRPLPDLLRERLSFVSAESRIVTERLLQAHAEASDLRAAVPSLSVGAWLQQIWTRLGGDACVDATARANLRLLWACLDKLPCGEPDLTGPALQAALDKLTAQPDPNAESDTGVHLMTIHKSKGLEFEIVILPELQARNRVGRSAMFSWLERGLAGADESGAITEFLIAPFQTKGADRGKAREWVDREYRAREAQEMRRIFYVAATRAREELHLFARPEYKLEQGGPVLCNPSASLLATAWPALETHVRVQFETWKSTPQPAVVLDLAATADVLTMPAPAKPALLRRLPANFAPPPLPHLAGTTKLAATSDDSRLYQRHEGGVLARALGSAVHRAMQELAQLSIGHDWNTARAKITQLPDRLTAEARSHGFDRDRSQTLATHALEIAMRASHDPVAAWILSPHPDAATEQKWTGILDGTQRTVQADRVFRAGSAPMSEAGDIWWIIDYKTTHSEADAPDQLASLRALFAPQLEAYAKVLRKLHGADVPIRAGLYYPRMLQFDWWEL